MIQLKYPEFWGNKTLLSYLLLPLGWLYLLLGKIRNMFTIPQKLPGYVICIGNMTVGGTGKTQLVIWLAKALQEQGIKVVLISKGYRGNYQIPLAVSSSMSPDLVGDEALELCDIATTIVTRKVTQARDLLNQIKPDVIIVDDGMQNNSFLKDRTVVVIDGERGFGNGLPIPAGPMRQRKSFCNVDATIVVCTNTRYDFSNIEPLFYAQITPDFMPDLGRNYYAFAGIGNPEKFFTSLRTMQINLRRTKSFPDHYNYTKQDLESLVEEARSLGLTLITSNKDYTKVKYLGYQEEVLSCPVKLNIPDSTSLIKSLYEKTSA